MHHDIPQEILLLAQLERRCRGICEDFLTCQQNQTLNKKQAGLLQPLPIPKGPWESVSMDFMVSLPPSRGFDAIMVVVDLFSKMAHFIPTKDNATAQQTGRLFFTHVFKHHGLPKDIVSD
jgi:hypothetical protein